MAKVLFIPVSIVSGLIAGIVGRKVFEWLWGLVDDEEPPDSEDRETSVPKLVASLAFQGAAFSVTRGLTDHFARQSFYRATGAWPGEERPDQTE
jgi:xanthosine utilization system XapX-like protein